MKKKRRFLLDALQIRRAACIAPSQDRNSNACVILMRCKTPTPNVGAESAHVMCFFVVLQVLVRGQRVVQNWLAGWLAVRIKNQECGVEVL